MADVVPAAATELGRLVRETWVQWASEQPSPKPSWLTPWDDLDGGQREVDTRIGEAVAAAEQDRLRPVLVDALEGMLEMFAYVPDYFRDKWEHQGYIDRLTTALTGLTLTATPRPGWADDE